MKRRKLLSQAAIGITGATAISCSGSSSPEKIDSDKELPVINWRMATSWPRFVDVFKSLNILCQHVEEMTDGRFAITPYEIGAIGEIDDHEKLLHAVAGNESYKGNKVHCGHTALYYFTNINPALAFGTAVPFGLNAQQQHAWLYRGYGIEVLQEVLDHHKLNLKWFPAGNTTTQTGGWFRKKIVKVDDLKGLRMRIPGLAGRVLERLGVIVEDLPPHKIVSALLENRVDPDKGINAVEWIGPSEDETLGLQKAAQVYYYPGWWEPGTSFALLINGAEWDALPPSYQNVLEAAAMETNLTMLARYSVSNIEALERFDFEGKKPVPFSKTLLRQFYQAALETYEECASNNEQFDRVYRQWQCFRERIYSWHQISSLRFSEIAYEDWKD